ncbi:redoxin domain-containing protein [Geobacter sp. DSM 9736]|uniref:redoxin domain-containing protein n=1 Tax=Geobacter sp. DSM 9736 TaxID=1277350 RepID=UPI000B508455|nr:redoxin domain-containing protein [Geobacter sp. DSM 9736]SNB46560.1 AhpC/TSA family protein [Geobacter sp. DSM 9736]
MVNDPSLPAEQEMFPSFALPDHMGNTLDIAGFRQHRNLVLCFVKKPAAAASFLASLAANLGELEESEAAVVVVVLKSKPEAGQLKVELGIPFPVLADTGGEIVNRFCPGDISVYVTDRFREVFLALHGPEQAPDASSVLQRLAFIERQCPE